jgi:hypothetical protein
LQGFLIWLLIGIFKAKILFCLDKKIWEEIVGKPKHQCRSPVSKCTDQNTSHMH